MGRYWSVEECGWAECPQAADAAAPVRAEEEPAAVPEQRAEPEPVLQG